MFDNLSDHLSQSIKKIRGQARLSEQNIKDALRDVRIALLEADVALPVVKSFVDTIRQRAVGLDVSSSLNPGQMLVKVVHEELVSLLGEHAPLQLSGPKPSVILVAGLQGAGKTTTVGKLALWLKQRERKKVAVVSVDVYRPAAMEQLRSVADSVEVPCLPCQPDESPLAIVERSVELARQQNLDVLLLDTAGRLHIDSEMMAEVQQIHQVAHPSETLFVVDSMTGQDAATTARAFDQALPLTGVVLTKTDGDARGGATLSIRQITGKPIKFMGTGEKPDALEAFHPDRVASRILGMGDVLTLVEELERKVDQKKTEKLAKKLAKGKGFTLEDFRQQLQQVTEMGGLGGMLEKLPGAKNLQSQFDQQGGNQQMKRLLAIINSMTRKEKRFPDLIKGSRKRRIANGSGTSIQEVNRLLKQFHQTQKMMKKGNMAKMMRAMQQRTPGGGMGGMPPGGMPPFG